MSPLLRRSRAAAVLNLDAKTFETTRKRGTSAIVTSARSQRT